MNKEQVSIEIAHMLELFQGVTAKGDGSVGAFNPSNYMSKGEKELRDYRIQNGNVRR